jgi:hypothetical protein
MQDDAMELVAYLSSHSGAKILAGVPLAAGAHPIELPPKMRDAQGQLVDRPAQPSLGELGADAGPLMNVVSGALAGGAGGKHVGDAIAAGGRGIEHSAQRTGDQVQRGMQVFSYVLNEGVQGHGRWWRAPCITVPPRSPTCAWCTARSAPRSSAGWARWRN